MTTDLGVPGLRQSIRAVLAHRRVSQLLTRTLRPCAGFLPHSVLDRVPIVGPFDVKLPDGGPVLHLESDGRDTQAAGVFWHGIGAHEPETFRCLAALSRVSDVFLDVGTNVGVYALSLAATFPALRVLAFEPVPHVFARLERNLLRNALTNVTISPTALSDHGGNRPLFIPPGDVPVEASLVNGLRKGATRVDVATSTLDQAVQDHRLEAVDLVKVDVEGHEMAVLVGAERTIARHAPTFVCEVLYGLGTGPDLVEYLRPRGYDFFALTAAGARHDPHLVGDPDFRELNYLLVHHRRERRVRSVMPFLG